MAYLKRKWNEIKEYITRWPRETWAWRAKKLENIVDDPVDDLKHTLHGLKLPFGYRLNISFLMMNRPTTWPIIYKDTEEVK